jgi:hypothetical protein
LGNFNTKPLHFSFPLSPVIPIDQIEIAYFLRIPRIFLDVKFVISVKMKSQSFPENTGFANCCSLARRVTEASGEAV